MKEKITTTDTNVAKKYREKTGFEWPPPPDYDSFPSKAEPGAKETLNNTNDRIINQMSEIRAQNNQNWMDILKLSFRVAPDEAKEIMQKIVECDEKIKDLSKELVK